MIDIHQEETHVQKIRTRLDLLKQTVEREEAGVAIAEETLERSREAQDILQQLAQAVQQQAHRKISDVVSSCLSAVFDEPYEFAILFELKRGRTEAVIRFRRNFLDVDPLTSCGGGQVDVAAFALRAACLTLHRPKLRRLLVLDEPFRFVSAEFQPNVRTMLEELSKDLGIQIIMVTHNEAYETGKVIRL